MSDPAINRAIKTGDRWHGSRQTPEEFAPFISRLRAARPEDSYTVSSRLSWDGLENANDETRREVAAFR